jgi:hypothetical protein
VVGLSEDNEDFAQVVSIVKERISLVVICCLCRRHGTNDVAVMLHLSHGMKQNPQERAAREAIPKARANRILLFL